MNNFLIRVAAVFAMGLWAWGLGGCGETGEPWLRADEPRLEVVDDFPAVGAREFSVSFLNDGDAPATVSDLTIENEAGSTGQVEWAQEPALPQTVEPGQRLELQLRFEPDGDHGGGCGFSAQALLTATWGGEGVLDRFGDMEIWFGGECDQALRCIPARLVIDDATVGRQAQASVTCRNTSSQAIAIEELTIDGDGADHFEADFGLSADQELGAGDALDGAITFRPPGDSEVAAQLNMSADNGDSFAVELAGYGEPLWSMCDASAPSAPDIPDEIDGYGFQLENPSVGSARGVLADTASVSEGRAPMLSRAFLIAEGAFLNDFCEVSSSGTSFRWEGMPCQDGPGTLFNILPIPLGEGVEADMDKIEAGDRVQFEGYDIERIEREGWWGDGGASDGVGNRAMFVTRICHPE